MSPWEPIHGNHSLQYSNSNTDTDLSGLLINHQGWLLVMHMQSVPMGPLPAQSFEPFDKVVAESQDALWVCEPYAPCSYILGHANKQSRLQHHGLVPDLQHQARSGTGVATTHTRARHRQIWVLQTHCMPPWFWCGFVCVDGSVPTWTRWPFDTDGQISTHSEF